MAEKLVIQTQCGEITIEVNKNDKYPGVLIKLNNTPVTLIEENLHNNEYKIIKKDYPNRSIINDNDYLNLDYFNISKEDLDNYD